MGRQFRPQLEHLEDRHTPATWGLPWPVPGRLTISFAPDGTAIGQHTSGLFDALAREFGPDPKAWQGEILSALQSWAIHAPINIVLVSDTGAPFGSVTTPQGSTLFGDIRIAGFDLGEDVLGVGVPFDATSSAWVGDVFFNTAIDFECHHGEYNLRPVALHEAAHVLGIPHSHELGSVVNPIYESCANLTDKDIESVREIYGLRSPDVYEGKSRNETLQTATSCTITTRPGELLRGDLTDAGDVDTFRLTFSESADELELTLNTSGMSLLAPQLEVFDTAGGLVWSGKEADVFAPDLSLMLKNVRAGDSYYFRIAGGAHPLFSVGAYSLRITCSSTPPLSVPSVEGTPIFQLAQQFGIQIDARSMAGFQSAVFCGSAGTTPETALALTQSARLLASPHHVVIHGDVLSMSSPERYYRFVVPDSDRLQTLTIAVASVDGKMVDPRMLFCGPDGHPLSGDIYLEGNGYRVYQFTDLRPGTVLSACVYTSDVVEPQMYVIAGDFLPVRTEMKQVTAGTLTSPDVSQETQLSIEKSSLVNFLVQASGPEGMEAGVRIEIRNGQDVVGMTEVEAGQVRGLKLFLPPGDYSVSAVSTSANSVTFSVRYGILSDPISPYKEERTLAPVDTTDLGAQPPAKQPRVVTSGSLDRRDNPVSLQEAIGSPDWIGSLAIRSDLVSVALVTPQSDAAEVLPAGAVLGTAKMSEFAEGGGNTETNALVAEKADPGGPHVLRGIPGDEDNVRPTPPTLQLRQDEAVFDRPNPAAIDAILSGLAPAQQTMEVRVIEPEQTAPERTPVADWSVWILASCTGAALLVRSWLVNPTKRHDALTDAENATC